MKFPAGIVFTFGLALAGALQAQTPAAPKPLAASQTPPIKFPEMPQASPLCTVVQRVGFTDVKIVYSRPSMRHHRSIFGGIVPYDDLWRTGDNASTKITFSTPVRLGGSNGVEVAAGTYGLYTIPHETTWSVALNKDAGLWGTEDFDPSKNVAQFQVIPVKLTDLPVETFTIDVNDIQDDSATINLIWARLRVPLKMEVDIVPDLLVKIKASMDSPAPKNKDTFLQAATFYFDHTKDLAQVLDWVNMGLIKSPDSYELLYLKAKVLAKQGDRAGATAAAAQSIQQAVAATPPDHAYLKMNQEVIDSLH